jgi:hypothetical protein
MQARGLVYGLVAIDSLPEGWRVPGERDDFVQLIHLLVQDPAERERLVLSVEAITGKLPDMTDWQGRGWRLE